jgi:hypothetical protein
MWWASRTRAQPPRVDEPRQRPLGRITVGLRASTPPLRDEFGRRAQSVARSPEARGVDRGPRFVDEALKLLARAFEPKRSDERRLAPPGILAGALSERRRVALGVEKIVGDLKRRPNRAAESAEAPVFIACRRATSPNVNGATVVSASMSSIWPPTMPARPAARASPNDSATRTSALGSVRGSARISKASACNASPARIAVASSKARWVVGRPRLRSSSSIAGRSSWISE